jgi:hypothetical protein
MNVIPVPELVVAFAVVVILVAVRAVVGLRSLPGAGPEGGARRSPSGGSPDQMRARLIASCVVFVIISIPLILGIVPPNGIYGFRVSGTRSREIWYPANAFMGWALLVASVIGATLQVILPKTSGRWLLWSAFLIPICGAVVASFAYLSRLLNAV